MLIFDGVWVGFGGRPVLAGPDLSVQRGELLALAGVNGCGKSSPLRLASGALPPHRGRVLLHSRDVAGRKRREVARELAVLHQHSSAVPGLTVRQLVQQDRYSHRGPIGMLRGGDDEAQRLVVIDGGRVAADGPSAQVLTAELLREVFGVHGWVMTDAASDAPLLAYDRLVQQPARPIVPTSPTGPAGPRRP